MFMKIKILVTSICLISILLITYIIYTLKYNSSQSTNPHQTNSAKNIENSDSASSQVSDNKSNSLKFDKFSPNTKWQDKVIKINGKNLNYRFGEGNPKETSLNPEDYKAKGEEDGSPYVTPETEKELYDFLSDEDLPAVLDKCENYNRQNMVKLNPNLPIEQIPVLLKPSDFDIENIMTVNTTTGRKEINEDIANRINEFLNILSNPLSGSEFADKCAGTAYSQSIIRIQTKFSDFSKSYINGGEGIQGKDWSK